MLNHFDSPLLSGVQGARSECQRGGVGGPEVPTTPSPAEPEWANNIAIKKNDGIELDCIYLVYLIFFHKENSGDVLYVILVCLYAICY